MLRPYQEGVTLVGPGGSWGDLAAGEAVASGLLERAEAIAEGRGGGIDGLSLFNFGDERGADDGGVGEAAKNRNVAGKRDYKTNGDGELRNAAGAADERGEIIGQHIFCAGDAGAGNQIEETGRASGDFREAVVGGSWSAEKDAVEMMHGENAAIVFGFFRREVRDEDTGESRAGFECTLRAALDRGAIGERVAEGDAEFDDVGTCFCECEDVFQ